MTIEDRGQEKGMEKRIEYGGTMGDEFGVTSVKGGFFWSSHLIQFLRKFDPGITEE